VAVHAVNKIPCIEGKSLLIVGGGTIGLLVAQVARQFKAGCVIISEIIPFRNKIAKQCGIASINPLAVDSFDRKLDDLRAGAPLHAVFECAGNESAFNTAVKNVSRGGYVIAVGVYESPIRAEMVLVQDKELNVLGSLMYTWDDYLKAVALISEGRVNMRLLQTHHFKFDRWKDGYKLLEDKPDEALKVLIDMD